MQWCFYRPIHGSSLLDQALRMPLPRIFPIAPGGEQQEIASHQACRHDHRRKLLQLFDVHPCIVTLPSAECRSRSRTVKLSQQRRSFNPGLVGIQLGLQFQAQGRPQHHRDHAKHLTQPEPSLWFAKNTAGHARPLLLSLV